MKLRGSSKQRSRAEIIVASLENRGGAVLTRDLDEAVQLANEYAPEHLGLSVSDPWRWVEKVNNAGGVFVGEHSFEVLGDYLAGPSHVMPTGGSARFASPLNVWDFVKIVSLVALDEGTAQTIGPSAATIADAEGLDAHGNAALLRVRKVLMKIRAHLESLPPYTPIEPFEVLSARIGREPSQIVKLDANENPYGPLPVVREALGKLDFPHIYPDPESRALAEIARQVYRHWRRISAGGRGRGRVDRPAHARPAGTGRLHPFLPAHLWHVFLRCGTQCGALHRSPAQCRFFTGYGIHSQSSGNLSAEDLVYRLAQ